jgi:hypothetical protein
MIRDPDTQVSSCCRAIVRYIHEQRLTADSKLPTQEELRRLLNFSHNSLTPAMNLLVESGMIQRKRRLGTVVVDPDAIPAGLWRIALALGILDNSPWCRFETILSRYLQEKIQRAGCQMRFYILNYDKFAVVPHELADFGLLEPDIASGKLDAIISPAFFSLNAYSVCEEHGVPLCNTGGWKEIPMRVEFDLDDLLQRAFKILKTSGRNRIAVIYDHVSCPDIGELVKSQSVTGGIGNDLDIRTIHGAENVDANGIAAGILKQDPSRRPEGLIILNDMLAQTLAALLSGTDYAPDIIVQTNKEIPLFYAMPVTRLELGIEELAEASVKMVLEKVTCLSLPVEMQTLKADYQEAHSSQA